MLVHPMNDQEAMSAVLRSLALDASALASGESRHVQCVVPEHDGAPAEHTVRSLLGPAGARLDVLVAVHQVHGVVEQGFRRAVAGEAEVMAAEREALELRRSGATHIAECTVVVAPAAGSRTPITLRVQAGSGTTPRDLAGVLARAASPVAVTAGQLGELRPRLSPGARLRIEHEPRGGAWAPTGCTITVESPVRRTLRAGTSLAMLLGSCDGEETAGSLYRRFAASAGAGDDLTEAGFAQVLERLIADGYLVLDPPDG